MLLYLQAKEKGVKIIDEDGLFSLIKAAPAPDAPPEEAPLPSPTPASAGEAASPSASGRRLPASFSGRASPALPSAAASTSQAGVHSLNVCLLHPLTVDAC